MLTSHRQDELIEWIKGMLNHSFVLASPQTYLDTMRYIEELLYEHYQNREISAIKQYVSSIGPLFTPLPVAAAFRQYDAKYAISARSFVAPSFNEVRHILNLAQAMAVGPTVRLITFDGDQTLYSDGGNFENSRELAGAILDLLCSGVNVAVVTAAGYGLNAPRYETRLQGLLETVCAVGEVDETAANRLGLRQFGPRNSLLFA